MLIACASGAGTFVFSLSGTLLCGGNRGSISAHVDVAGIGALTTELVGVHVVALDVARALVVYLGVVGDGAVVHLDVATAVIVHVDVVDGDVADVGVAVAIVIDMEVLVVHVHSVLVVEIARTMVVVLVDVGRVNLDVGTARIVVAVVVAHHQLSVYHLGIDAVDIATVAADANAILVALIIVDVEGCVIVDHGKTVHGANVVQAAH